MLAKLFSIFCKGKGAKVTGGLAGTGGIFAILFGLHTDISLKIDKAEANSKVYADSKHELIKQDVAHLREGQTDIKSMLKVIDQRLYNMKKAK